MSKTVMRYFVRSSDMCRFTGVTLNDITSADVHTTLVGTYIMVGRFGYALWHVGDFNTKRETLRCFATCPTMCRLELKATGFVGSRWTEITEVRG